MNDVGTVQYPQVANVQPRDNEEPEESSLAEDEPVLSEEDCRALREKERKEVEGTLATQERKSSTLTLVMELVAKRDVTGGVASERASALVLKMLAGDDLPRGCMPTLLVLVRQTVPEAFSEAVTQQCRLGTLLAVEHDDRVTRFVLMLREELVGELELKEAWELSILDVAIASLIRGRKAAALADTQKKCNMYARVMSVAQAAENEYLATIQYLRTRRQPPVNTVQVAGASNVGIQVNGNGPAAKVENAQPAGAEPA